MMILSSHLSGLDLRDVSSLAFQGSALASDLQVPELETSKSSSWSAGIVDFTVLGNRQCSLAASLRFDKFPSISLSGRPVESPDDGTFDDNSDGWIRMLGTVSTHNVSTHNGSGTPKLQSREKNTREGRIQEGLNRNTDLKPYDDLEGQVVSPDCGLKILLSAQEVDIISLGGRIMQFAFFFVLKSLLEVGPSSLCLGSFLPWYNIISSLYCNSLF